MPPSETEVSYGVQTAASVVALGVKAIEQGFSVAFYRLEDRLREVPRRLHAVEEALAGHRHGQRPPHRLALAGPVTVRPTFHPWPRSPASSSSTARSSSTPLSGVAEWIW